MKLRLESGFVESTAFVLSPVSAYIAQEETSPRHLKRKLFQDVPIPRSPGPGKVRVFGTFSFFSGHCNQKLLRQSHLLALKWP